MEEFATTERKNGGLMEPCCPMRYGTDWSVPFWTHRLSRTEKLSGLEKYAEDLKVELEEVNKEITSLKEKK